MLKAVWRQDFSSIRIPGAVVPNGCLRASVLRKGCGMFFGTGLRKESGMPVFRQAPPLQALFR